MEFFFRLNVIRMVLEHVYHFGGLFNHSTSGICQIVSIHNLVANRFLFKRFLMKIERFKKIILYGIAFGFIHGKWRKKNKIFKQIPPSTYYQLFSL